MNPFVFIYTEFLFRPIFNLLVIIANAVPGYNLGLAIIIVTIIIRVLLLPSSIHQAKQMSKNQGKMEKIKQGTASIKEKHKDDQAKQAEETMKLYKEVGFNPVSGCLPLLIQLPIIIALYRVFLIGINPETFHYLYSFVSAPEVISSFFAGIDLQQPNIIFGVVAGIAQFIQMKMVTPPKAEPKKENDNDPAAMMSSMQKNMAYTIPAMTIFISLQLPAALPLYWIISTLFGIGQQYYIKKILGISMNQPVM